jgi:DNA transposition AAA+ family ATPase
MTTTETLSNSPRLGEVRNPEGITAPDANTHVRLKIPINLANWKHLPDHVQTELLWFHQHALDESMGLEEAAEAVNYSENAVYKVLKGTYENGNYNEFCKAVASYKAAFLKRQGIHHSEFVPNRNTRLIYDAFDWAAASSSIAFIIGESGTGKTITGKQWALEHNHGRTVMTEAREFGGVKGLMVDISIKIGADKDARNDVLRAQIHRGFNRNRFLIVDELHRLLPKNPATIPVSLEFLRALHDATGLPIGCFATDRLLHDLNKSHYQSEQLLGRIGSPIRLYTKFDETDLRPLLAQYFDAISDRSMSSALAIANNELEDYKGRWRVLVKTLQMAQNLAKKSKSRVTETHFLKAMAVRKQMLGAVGNVRD